MEFCHIFSNEFLSTYATVSPYIINVTSRYNKYTIQISATYKKLGRNKRKYYNKDKIIVTTYRKYCGTIIIE
jgi:hypothetical protein